MFIYRELALLILHFFKQVIYNCTSVIFSMWLFKILVCVIRYGLFLTDPDLVTHSMTHIIFNFEIEKNKNKKKEHMSDPYSASSCTESALCKKRWQYNHEKYWSILEEKMSCDKIFCYIMWQKIM